MRPVCRTYDQGRERVIDERSGWRVPEREYEGGDLARWADGWAAGRGLVTPRHLSADLLRLDRDEVGTRAEFVTLRPDLTAAIVHAGVRGSGARPGNATLTLPVVTGAPVGRLSADYKRLGWAVAPEREWLLSVEELAVTGPVVPVGYTLRPTGPAALGGTLLAVEALDGSGRPVAYGVVASAALGDTTAVIGRIKVEPDHRRRGVGAALLTWLGSAAARQGLRRALVVAGPAGRALAEGAGWRVRCELMLATLPPTAPERSVRDRTARRSNS